MEDIREREKKLLQTKIINQTWIDGRFHKSLVGEHFDRLTVEKLIGLDARSQAYYLCTCVCGNQIITTAGKLKNGHTRSCGCLRSDINAQMRRDESIHGLWNSRIYNTYSNMLSRCYNKNDIGYSKYGGRGIRVCSEWLEKDQSGHRIGFIRFADWAYKHGYTDDLTIDRIDPNGNYEPSNCRWVSQKIQNMNKTNSIFIKCDGYSFPISIWEKITGISSELIRYRFSKHQPPEKILHTPVHSKGYLTWSVDPKYLKYDESIIKKVGSVNG